MMDFDWLGERYELNMTDMIEDLFKAYENKNPIIRNKKHKDVASNIRLCFDYLIIPANVLTNVLAKLNKKKGKDVYKRETYEQMQIDIMQSVQELFIDRFNGTDTLNEGGKGICAILENLKRNMNILNEKAHCHITLALDFDELKDNIILPDDKEKEVDTIIKKLKDMFKEHIMTNVEAENALDWLAEKKLITEDSVPDDILERIQQIADKNESIREAIIDVYDKLIQIKYALYPYWALNLEYVYGLYFVKKGLFKNAPILMKLVDKHISLHKNMMNKLPRELQPTEFIDEKYIACESDRDLVTCRYLPFIIKEYGYFTENEKKKLSFYKSNTFKNYCQTMLRICQKTELLFLDIRPKEYTNLNRFLKLVGWTEAELAKIFGMTPSTFSKAKKKSTKGITDEFAAKLSYLFNLSEDFIMNKTTIPMDGINITPIAITAGEHSILAQFKQYYTNLNQNMSEQKIDDRYMYLIRFIDLLERRIRKKRSLKEVRKELIAIARLLSYK